MLTNLLREELQAFEKQIVGLELSRESDLISGAMADKLRHYSSDLSEVSEEIHRYKDLYIDRVPRKDIDMGDLYGDHSEASEDLWDVISVPKLSDNERASLELPSRVTWDDDGGIDSSDSLEDPFVDDEQFAPRRSSGQSTSAISSRILSRLISFLLKSSIIKCSSIIISYSTAYFIHCI
jgi:hypothetical protein